MIAWLVWYYKKFVLIIKSITMKSMKSKLTKYIKHIPLLFLYLILLYTSTAVIFGKDIDESFELLSDAGDNRGSLIEVENLYAKKDKETMTILVTGKNLQEADVLTFFVDTDNSSETGYLKWRDSGADLMIENGRIYSSTENSAGWNWELYSGCPDASLEIDENGTSVKLTLQLKGMKCITHQELGIAFMYQSRTNSKEKGYIPRSGVSMPFIGRNENRPLIESIPNGVGLGIDDLGWDSGYYPKDETARILSDEMRTWELADYQNVIDIGREVGSRLMTAWIMGHLDKNGIAAKPEYNPPFTTNFMTKKGLTPNSVDNPEKVEALMALVEAGADAMEFGIHGVSHEHYYPMYGGEVGRISREFAFKPEGSRGISYRYEWKDLIKRMECYIELIRQFYDEETCSMPESIVFPGHGYYYGDGSGDETTGRLMNMFGVKYANGDTESTTNVEWGVIDNGLLFIQRAFGAPYDSIAATPWDGTNYPDGEYLPNSYGWTEAHFPNLWNTEVTSRDGFDRWVAYLSGLNDAPDRFLAANTIEASSQWLYRNFAQLIPVDKQTVIIDTTSIPDDAYSYELISTLVLKVPLKLGKHVSSAEVDHGAKVFGYKEDEYGYGYLLIGNGSNTMGRLSPDTQYTVSITLGPDFMESYLDMYKKTFNVYAFDAAESQISVGIKMYGTQEIVIRTPRIPKTLLSDNRNLKILEATYDAPFLRILAKGKDIQGEIAVLKIELDSHY